jgi:hypothetical protein
MRWSADEGPGRRTCPWGSRKQDGVSSIEEMVAGLGCGSRGRL